jgi:hypothetical protein
MACLQDRAGTAADRRSCFLRASPNTSCTLSTGLWNLAGEAWKSQKERLEGQAAQIRQHTPGDDRLVDDFAQLDAFAAFSALA